MKLLSIFLLLDKREDKFKLIKIISNGDIRGCKFVKEHMHRMFLIYSIVFIFPIWYGYQTTDINSIIDLIRSINNVFKHIILLNSLQLRLKNSSVRDASLQVDLICLEKDES